MRGYKTLIQEAELMAMPPEVVAEFLRQRAGQSKDEARNDPVDEDVEKALRARSDPLIDLSLARHGRQMAVVSELFQSSAPGSPTRLACLANRSLGHEIFQSFPTGLFGGDTEPVVAWLQSASDDELSALFENPTLTDSFIRDLLERSHGWESIESDRLCQFVSVLHGNPRMRTPRDNDHMDGYAEYNYGSVFDAAWKLAETAPSTKDWAFSLGWLYDQLETDTFSIKDPLALTARWHVSADDTEANERQTKDHEIGYLGNMERVRKGLARLALSKDRTLLAELLSSDDVALRAAAYSSGPLNADQLRSGYEKDGKLVFTEAIGNMHLWRTQATRQALHDVAWDVVSNDKYSDLMAANLYNRMEKDVRKNYPAWFADEDAEQAMADDGAEESSPATRADIALLSGQLDRNAQRLDAITKGLEALMSRAGWIWWFSLGAVVASLLHI
jgi:hypothetical protein